MKILKFGNLKIYLGNFKISKNALRNFVPNRPHKHVITSINLFLQQVIDQIF